MAGEGGGVVGDGVVGLALGPVGEERKKEEDGVGPTCQQVEKSEATRAVWTI